jgi:hypothetical protein
MTDERRKSKRIKLAKPAEARLRTFISAQVLDISADGLLMRVRKPLSAGASYGLRFTSPLGEIEVRGTVRRCWLVGFETDENADRVRVYSAALEFGQPVPKLAQAFGAGLPVTVQMEERPVGP